MGPTEQLAKAVRRASAEGTIQSIYTGYSSYIAFIQDKEAPKDDRISLDLKNGDGPTFQGIPIKAAPDLPAMVIMFLMQGGKVIQVDLIG